MSAAHPHDIDVLIVGAGISGIDMAYRVHEANPGLTYLVVDGRTNIGGTWDLFRYPGIRSDSDFFTLAYPFHPWRGDDAIVSGAQIRDYLDEVVDTHGIRDHIRTGTQVTGADWSSEESRWTVDALAGGEPIRYRAKFLITCTGYYDYEKPYDAGFAGTDDYDGTIVHPQFWPGDLDVRGKRVTVIGSGATAVTLVPSLVDAGADVTMLQRTPSYVLAQPRRDPVANLARRVLPARAAHQVVRTKNTALQWVLYQTCRRAPTLMRSLLRKGAIAGTGSEALVDEHFNPPYAPWDQRLCIAPEGDLYAALKSGGARMVTGHVDRFVPGGVRLTTGDVVESDVVVTATGLSIQLLGGVGLTLDGQPVDLSKRFAYHGAMLSGVPNFAFCIGYVNLSWTMRADLTSRLVARILRRLARSGSASVTPRVPADLGAGRPLMDMQSGYLARAADLMPRAGDRYPWAMAQNIVKDAWATNRADLDRDLVWQAASPVAEPQRA